MSDGRSTELRRRDTGNMGNHSLLRGCLDTQGRESANRSMWRVQVHIFRLVADELEISSSRPVILAPPVAAVASYLVPSGEFPIQPVQQP